MRAARRRHHPRMRRWPTLLSLPRCISDSSIPASARTVRGTVRSAHVSARVCVWHTMLVARAASALTPSGACSASKRLPTGDDIAMSNSAVHTLARNMNNFVYLVGDRGTGEVRTRAGERARVRVREGGHELSPADRRVKLLDTWEPRTVYNTLQKTVASEDATEGARGKARASVARPVARIGHPWQEPWPCHACPGLATLARALPRQPGPCHGPCHASDARHTHFRGPCHGFSEVPRCLGVSQFGEGFGGVAVCVPVCVLRGRRMAERALARKKGRATGSKCL